jgi:hypothetical protein
MANSIASLSKKKIKLTISLLVLCLALSYISIRLFFRLQTQTPTIQTFNYSRLQSGDLIFRRGEGVLSQMLFSADKNSTFSHVGIIKLVNNRPLVIHASTGEPLGTDAIVRMDSLETFLKRDKTSAIAIYRLKEGSLKTSEKVANIAQKYADQKLAFDSDFDLKTPDRLYCTELVWKAYQEAGIDLVDGKFDQLNIPFKQGFYLLPSRLLASQYLKKVYSLSLTHP